jgi:hypothetical protein
LTWTTRSVPAICIHECDRKPFKHDRVWIVPEQHLLAWIRAQHESPVPFERLALWADTLSKAAPAAARYDA